MCLSVGVCVCLRHVCTSVHMYVCVCMLGTCVLERIVCVRHVCTSVHMCVYVRHMCTGVHVCVLGMCVLVYMHMYMSVCVC